MTIREARKAAGLTQQGLSDWSGFLFALFY